MAHTKDHHCPPHACGEQALDAVTFRACHWEAENRSAFCCVTCSCLLDFRLGARSGTSGAAALGACRREAAAGCADSAWPRGTSSAAQQLWVGACAERGRL